MSSTLENVTPCCSFAARCDRLWAWGRSHSAAILWGTVLLQVGILSSMIVLHSLPFIFGQHIIVRVQPVDPRDLFRGDYVILRYDFNSPQGSSVEGAPEPSYDYKSDSAKMTDRVIYATLEPDSDGRHHRAVRYSLEQPESGVFIKGLCSYYSHARCEVRYGVEAYFVQEGAGLELEKERNQNNLSAELVVAPWGAAKLVRLIPTTPAPTP